MAEPPIDSTETDMVYGQMVCRAYDMCYGFGAHLPATEEAPAPAPQASVARARWFWGEDEGNITKHNPADVKQPGNWVSYAGSVCAELDERYAQWKKGAGPAQVEIDLNDRIGSTGTEQKAHNQHTGVVFVIDMSAMTQTNKKSGFQRRVLREEHTAEKVADFAPFNLRGSAAGKPKGAALLRKSTNAAMAIKRAGASGAPTTAESKPGDIAEEDSLILYAGQLLQTSKTRPDGWAFGSVVLDVMDERPPIGVDGMSTQAGWFPLSKTDLPTPAQLGKLQQQMGGGVQASEALQPPPDWTPVKDPLTPDIIALSEGAEKQKIVHAFMKTLGPHIKVQEVLRIQNTSMWQSYAVKRQTVLQREKDSAAAKSVSQSRFERVWLFHGTDQDTVPKIIEMGFNRIFCGKNATAFGKGVYFARDASYSSSTTYSRPNANGVQHMFLCRVVVGEYCLGKRDALTPDVRQGHQLYDSTVNNMSDPGMYVTFHDSQAYPEYLIKFKQ